MNEAVAYREMIQGASDAIASRVAEVPADKLHARPGDGLNPVGWNYWHALRVWDLDLNWLIKGQDTAEDAWHRGNFSEKSGYNPDGIGLRGTGIGLGYSDEEVDALNVISADVLKEYHEMLLAETMAYLDGADDAEIRREFPGLAGRGDTSVAVRLQHLVTHTWGHIGELSYAKGMLGMTDGTYPGQS
ncbi:MAG: DinB family protein [Thermomicrobiales bacterium]